MDHSKVLGEESIEKLIVKFSIPAIIGMLVNALYNVVDRIFIGNGVGSLALSGLTVTFPIMLISMALSMLIGLGATSLISIKLGEKKKEEAEKIAANAFTLLIVVSLIYSVVFLLFLDKILLLFGASQNTLAYARDYLSIILYGSIFQFIGFGMNHFIRAEGNPKRAMSTMVIGAVLNTVLDPLFIFVFKMGVQGAAIATIISQAVSAAWVLYYFMAKKSTVKIHAANMKLSWKYVRQIVSMGLAPFSIQLVGSIYNLILNNSLARYGGDKAIAAMGIISSAGMIIMMPVFGINQGTQPIVGYNYGAGKYDRVKKALMYAYIGATSVVILGFLMAMLFPTQIIQFFNRTDGELVSIGVPAMRIFSLLMPVIGFQIVSSNYFQAIGKPKKSMFLTLLRQLIVLIPMVIILPLFFGLNGIWYAVPMSDGISTMLTAVFMYFEMKELNRKITETVKVPAI